MVRFVDKTPQNGLPPPSPQDGAGHVEWPAPSAPTPTSSSQNPFLPFPATFQYPLPFPQAPPIVPQVNPFRSPAFPRGPSHHLSYPSPYPASSFPDPSLVGGTQSWENPPPISLESPPPCSAPPLIGPPTDVTASLPQESGPHGPASDVKNPAPLTPSSGSHASPSGSHDTVARSDRSGGLNREPEPIPFAAPVTYSQRRGNPHWRSLDYSIKKEVCKAQKEFGRESTYFKGLVRTTFSSNILLPRDIKDLFGCLLSSTEYTLWEKVWKRSLAELLNGLLQTPEAAVDADGKLLSIQLLSGEGEWEDAEAQAEKIPKPVVLKIQKAAEEALLGLPTAGPLLHYATVKQGPTEPIIDFVERLRNEIGRQVLNKNSHEQLILEMVKLNSNEACKKVIYSLPHYPEPTLADILDACSRRAAVAAVIPANNRGPLRAAAVATKRFPPAHASCFLCGRPGHFARDCPEKAARRPGQVVPNTSQQAPAAEQKKN